MSLNTFDDAAVRKIAHTVGRLKNTQIGLRRQIREMQTRYEHTGMQMQTGVTASTTAQPNYPPSGCTLPFATTDASFDDEAVGSCPTFELLKWGHEFIGRTTDGKYIPEGVPIMFVQIQTPKGRRFWIMGSSSIPEDPSVAAPGRWLIAREHLQPGGISQAAFAVYNPATDLWFDDGSDPAGSQRIHDDAIQACLLSGEMVWCESRPQDDTNNPDGLEWDITSSVGLQRRAQVLLDIPCGASGQVEIWADEASASCTGAVVAPQLSVTLCNSGQGYQRHLFGAGSTVANQDFIWIEFDRYRWYPVRDSRPTLAWAQATATFCQDPVVSVNGINYSDYADRICSLANPQIINVANPEGLAGDTQNRMMLHWNEANAVNPAAAWEVVQVTHTVADVANSFIDANGGVGCQLPQAVMSKIITQQSTKCAVVPNQTIVTFVQQNVVSSIRFDNATCSFMQVIDVVCVADLITAGPELPFTSGVTYTAVVEVKAYETDDGDETKLTCGLEIATAQVCSLNLPDTNSPIQIPFEKSSVVGDVIDTATGLDKTLLEVFSLCANSPDQSQVVPYTDCDGEGGTEAIP